MATEFLDGTTAMTSTADDVTVDDGSGTTIEIVQTSEKLVTTETTSDYINSATTPSVFGKRPPKPKTTTTHKVTTTPEPTTETVEETTTVVTTDEPTSTSTSGVPRLKICDEKFSRL